MNDNETRMIYAVTEDGAYRRQGAMERRPVR